MQIQTNYNTYLPNYTFQKHKLPPKSHKPVKSNSNYYAGASGIAALTGAYFTKKHLDSRYIRQLAKDLSIELKETVKPSQLKAVMGKKEFLSTIKKLKKENYTASPQNIKKGIFIADLHSHSNFSDGKLSVDAIMNQAAEYGDRLNKINGKKFIFALSDHDGVDGVKEALKIIAKNPDKFKNIKFVPAAELSFYIECHPQSNKFKRCGNEYEMAEMLIYNINPFSVESRKYFHNLYRKRNDSIAEYITKMNNDLKGYKFSEPEFKKFWDSNNIAHCMMNQHWNLYHYFNLKTRITDIAKNSNKNSEILFDKILTDMQTNKTSLTGEGLEAYLRKNNIDYSGQIYDERLDNIKQEMQPRHIINFVLAPMENSFQQISDYAKKEKAFLGFAHPGFTMQNMCTKDMLNNMKQYMEKAEGRVICAEKFHQAYPIPENITQEELNKYNKVLDELDLIHIGGRDNHSLNFTKFAD